MKYIITRTSLGSDEEIRPHEKAELVTIRQYSYANMPYINARGGDDRFVERFKERCTDIEELPSGVLRGISKRTMNVWMIEIDDIHSFIDEEGGEFVLSCEEYPDYGKLYTIEIYDYYRE